jgi:multidrug efflux system membrane fusion protein
MQLSAPRLALRLGLAAAGIGALVVGAIAVAAPHGRAAPPDVPAPAVPAFTAPATRQDVPILASGVGTVQAYQSVLVRSRVDGELERYAVTEGQDVKQGDLIAVIDPRPYQAILDQARARLAQDQAQLADARLDLARYQSLARQSFAPVQQVDTQRALVDQDTAAIAGDAASIEAAQLNLSFCQITAPFDGRVGLRLVDPGNLVHATDTTGIITITEIHPISVTFTLPQEELPRVQTDMAHGNAPVLAYSSDNRTLLGKGTLLTPDNTIDTSTGTIRLKATFPNQNNRLWPGQFINARLQTGVAHDAVTIPGAAVEHGENGLYVFVVQPDSTVAVRNISVGYQTGALAIVTAGLSGGETVVVNGQSRLEAGTRVAARTRQTDSPSP